MELTFRDVVTVLHGMGFGALFMLAFSGAIGVIYATAIGGGAWSSTRRHERMFRIYLISMAVLSWLTVLSGTYLVYPWYRAKPPTGAVDLAPVWCGRQPSLSLEKSRCRAKLRQA